MKNWDSKEIEKAIRRHHSAELEKEFYNTPAIIEENKYIPKVVTSSSGKKTKKDGKGN